MPSLKEIKGRIDSVKSTLKITSAMKLVASAKLRKAQQAAERCTAYENELHGILSTLPAVATGVPSELADAHSTAVVALSSNSSLCGGFNANAIRAAKAEIARLTGEGRAVTVYAIGKKIADALAKAGYPSVKDLSGLSAHPSYAGSSSLAQELVDGWYGGKFEEVYLIYNHFVSTASQKVKVEKYLPFSAEESSTSAMDTDEILLEPSPEELVRNLLPKTLRLKIYSVVLDSAAAEHAARTVAMQTATDNGNEILADLTLEYNKSRQGKITSEILDLAGGAAQQQ